MRKPVFLAIIALSSTLLVLLHTFHNLISLCLDDVKVDQIPSAQLQRDPRPGRQYIPKIIHHTWRNETIPEKWQAAYASCLDLHPEYTYKLWTDEGSRDFIRREYPWFLRTFDSYKYPIQRADVIRYFVLYHYGGIYIDLDDGCQRSLDPLLKYHAWVREAVPVGISNDVMGASPKHPFFEMAIAHLKSYNVNWVIPYATVMFSTGPMFLSLILERYKRLNFNSETGRVRILSLRHYKNFNDAFFFYTEGSSWHEGDAAFVFWLKRHWLLFTVLCTCTVLSLIFLIYYSVNGCYVRARKSRHYQHLELGNDVPILYGKLEA